LLDDEPLDFLLYGEEHLEQFIIPEFEEVINRPIRLVLELNSFKEIVQVKVQLNKSFQVLGNQRVHLLNPSQELICFTQLLQHFLLRLCLFLLHLELLLQFCLFSQEDSVGAGSFGVVGFSDMLQLVVE
jgi:hypothetical protein